MKCGGQPVSGNDTHGHPTGDQVLRRVVAILKASARKIDIVARSRLLRLEVGRRAGSHLFPSWS